MGGGAGMGIEEVPWSRDGEAGGDGGGESGSGSRHGIEMTPWSLDGDGEGDWVGESGSGSRHGIEMMPRPLMDLVPAAAASLVEKAVLLGLGAASLRLVLWFDLE